VNGLVALAPTPDVAPPPLVPKPGIGAGTVRGITGAAAAFGIVGTIAFGAFVGGAVTLAAVVVCATVVALAGAAVGAAMAFVAANGLAVDPLTERAPAAAGAPAGAD